MFKYVDSVCKLEALGFIFDPIEHDWRYEDKRAYDGIIVRFTPISFAELSGSSAGDPEWVEYHPVSAKATKLFCDMVQQGLIEWVDE